MNKNKSAAKKAGSTSSKNPSGGKKTPDSGNKTPSTGKSQGPGDKSDKEKKANPKKRANRGAVATQRRPRQEGDGVRFNIDHVRNERRRFLALKTAHEELNTSNNDEVPWNPWEHEFEWTTPLGDLRILRSNTLAKKYARLRKKYPDDAPSKP